MLVHLVSCWFTSTAPDHDPLRISSQGLVHRRFGWLGRLHDPHASGEYRDLEFASGDRNFDENLLDILITSRTDRKSVWIFEAGVSLGTTSAPSQPKGDGNQCCSAQKFGISECFVIFCACDRFRHTRVTGCLHSSYAGGEDRRAISWRSTATFGMEFPRCGSRSDCGCGSGARGDGGLCVVWARLGGTRRSEPIVFTVCADPGTFSGPSTRPRFVDPIP